MSIQRGCVQVERLLVARYRSTTNAAVHRDKRHIKRYWRDLITKRREQGEMKELLDKAEMRLTKNRK